MVDPWKTDKRPRFPNILEEVLEEEKEDPNEGVWKPLLRDNPDLQEKVREREEELEKELQDSFGVPDDGLDRTLDDIL